MIPIDGARRCFVRMLRPRNAPWPSPMPIGGAVRAMAERVGRRRDRCSRDGAQPFADPGLSTDD
ncbi:hypothetical protein A8H36_10485 [Burkholderia thailandensis]|nr:hypothetical protein A8H36_10485 [Burkholderia thailandensis]